MFDGIRVSNAPFRIWIDKMVDFELLTRTSRMDALISPSTLQIASDIKSATEGGMDSPRSGTPCKAAFTRLEFKLDYFKGDI